jgi:hypothetical protein
MWVVGGKGNPQGNKSRRLDENRSVISGTPTKILDDSLIFNLHECGPLVTQL